MSGRLVLVSTPIGNLEDLSPRARRVLEEADVIAAEDTRRTGRLLAAIDVGTPQISYHEHNERQRLPELVGRISDGQTVALVTDAGTPGVSDPGYRLARACADADATIEAVPGPSAVLHALVVSALPTDRFVFDGFLPRRGRQRRERLEELAHEHRTLVLFVSPHRAAEDVADLAAALGSDRPAALCREMTKLHEEVVRTSLGDLAAAAAERPLRGEVTLVIQGAVEAEAVQRGPDELAEAVALRESAGIDRRAAIAEVAVESGIPKREVYQAVVDAKGERR